MDVLNILTWVGIGMLALGAVVVVGAVALIGYIEINDNSYYD